MKFLSVFCVVLYLHIRVSTSNRNNEGDLLYEQHRNNNFRRDNRPSLDSQIITNESPTSENWQRQKVLEENLNTYKQFTNPFIKRKDITLESQDLSLKSVDHTTFSVQNPTETIFIRPLQLNSQNDYNYNWLKEEITGKSHIKANKLRLLPNKISLESQNETLYKLNSEQNNEIAFPNENSQIPILSLQNAFKSSKNLNINEPNRKLKQEEDTRFELQGVSLDSIMSRLNTSILKKPLEHQMYSSPLFPNFKLNKHKTENLNSLDHDLNDGKAQSNKSYYKSPSAEILYKMKQASPYIINNQQPADTSQGHNNLGYILDNAKSLLDLHASAKQRKRYIIIHRDGKVENVDNLATIAHYPNYISVKSSDLKKYVNGNVNYLPASLVQRRVKTNPLLVPYTNVNKAVKNFEDQTINGASKSTFIGIDEVKSKETSDVIKKSETKKINSDGEPLSFQNNHRNRFPTTINASKLSNISANPSPMNETELKKLIGSQNSSIDMSTKDYKKVSSHINTPQANLLKSKSNTLLKNSSFETLQLNATTLKDNNYDNKDISNNSSLTKNTNMKKFNVTSNSTKDHTMNDTTINEISLQNAASLNESRFWFQANEHFWDKIINETQNVYFLFVPPPPQAEKETKTTIYANGTTVEEVIETINDEYGETKVLKTTKVTHTDNNINPKASV